jgi:hypothetical protein
MSSVYIELFNGRNSLDEQLDDWGSAGPIFGPFECLQTTYATEIKLHKADKEWIGSLNFVEDTIYYDGVYYGDWAVYSDAPKMEKPRLAEFDPKLATVPSAVTETQTSAGIVVPEDSNPTVVAAKSKIAAYVAGGGVECPFCGCENLDGESVETGEGAAEQVVNCTDCGSSWTDSYKLVGLLRVNVQPCDLADFDRFECDHCHKIKDNDDSRKIGKDGPMICQNCFDKDEDVGILP